MKFSFKSLFFSLIFSVFIVSCQQQPDYSQQETLFLVTLSQFASSGKCKADNQFWARDLTVNGNTSYCVQSNLVGESDAFKIYAEDGLVNDLDYTAITKAFRDTIYPISQKAFGVPSDINQDGKVTILILDIKDGATSTSGFVAGFVDPINFMADNSSYSVRSNQMEILYMDGNELAKLRQKELAKGLPDTFLATMAHEFQHLIRYPNSNGKDDTWVDEGTSEVASDITGYGPQTARMECFRGSAVTSCNGGMNGRSVLVWGNTLQDYAFSYAFMKYLYEISGSTAEEKLAFLSKTVVGDYRASNARGLMTAFTQAARYDSNVLPSDSKKLFKYLYATFLGQALNYTQYTKAYLGSTKTDLSAVRNFYPLPDSLAEIKTPDPFSAISAQESISLSPGQAYRFNGTANNITANEEGVLLISDSSEYLLFNGNIDSNMATTTATTGQLLEPIQFPKLKLPQQQTPICPREILHKISKLEKSIYNLKPYIAEP